MSPRGEFRPCAIVPVYDHPEPVGRVIDSLLDHGLTVFVVDDGSSEACARHLDSITRDRESVVLICHEQNRGKGAAVLLGARTALAKGHTHGLQVDADNQHDLEAIPGALREAEQHPRAMVAGSPIFDESAPTSRRYGRWASHVFVWLNTWSFAIPDGLCGFRVYPLAETVSLANRYAIGRGMEFDIEIAVRLSWDTVPVRSVPVAVRYPEDGISHFKLWRDNLAIARVHTQLFFGMLLRAPLLFWHRIHSLLGF